jgi:hypothetical protein
MALVGEGEVIKPILKNVEHEFDVEIGAIGVTLRKGFKWANVERGTLIDLYFQHSAEKGLSDEFRGTARVVGHWVGQLKDLPARVIEMEHEASSRLYGGLLESLRRGYGSVTESDYFTALFYQRVTVAGQVGAAAQA